MVCNSRVIVSCNRERARAERIESAANAPDTCGDGLDDRRRKPSLAAEFGARLRSLRDLRGLTQQQLADRLKAAKSRISRYESGSALPEAETLVTLAEVLEVSIDELLLGRANGAGDDGVQDVRLRDVSASWRKWTEIHGGGNRGDRRLRGEGHARSDDRAAGERREELTAGANDAARACRGVARWKWGAPEARARRAPSAVATLTYSRRGPPLSSRLGGGGLDSGGPQHERCVAMADGVLSPQVCRSLLARAVAGPRRRRERRSGSR